MRLLAFDLETHKIQPGLLSPPIVCASEATSEGVVLQTKEEFLEYNIDRVFLADKITGANIAYDWGCLLAVHPEWLHRIWQAYEEGRVHDVQIASILNAIADGRIHDQGLYRKDGTKIQSGRYSLSECVLEWLGRKDAKINDVYRTSYALLEDTPLDEWPEVAKQYPLDDAQNTYEVAVKQLAGARNLHDQPLQAHFAFCAHLSAIHGLRTDPVAVAALQKEVFANIERLTEFAIKKGYIVDGVKKKEPIGEAVMKAYQGAPPTTEKGGISTSRETLEESGDEDLETFAEFSKWEKFGTYLPVLEQGTTRPINFQCNPVLSTGRSSYDGLIQLMPRKGGVRECFVSRPGTFFCSVDYSAVEMSTLAQVCLWTVKFSKLAEAINNNFDVHSLFASKLAGLTYDVFVSRKEEPLLAALRQAAKAANFGFPGMMGAAKFVVAQKKAGHKVCTWFGHVCGVAKKPYYDREKTMLGILCEKCVEEADNLRTGFVKQWPEIRPYWNWVSVQLEPKKELTQFISKRVRGGLHGPSGANTLFQGLASEAMKRSVIRLTKEMYLDTSSALYGSRLLISLHDEAFAELREERATEAALRQTEIMLSEAKECVPDVLIKAEPALMRRWYKDAKPVWENGKLVPWFPSTPA